MSKETTRYIITTIATFALVITVTVSQAWTSPTAAPAGGNVSAPLTTGNGSQTKLSGNLSLGGGGSIYAGGVVAAPTLCIGGDCRGAWPVAAADNFGNHTATMNINMSGRQVTNLGATANPSDSATKAYVDAAVIAAAVPSGTLCGMHESGIAGTIAILCKGHLPLLSCPLGYSQQYITASYSGPTTGPTDALISCIKN